MEVEALMRWCLAMLGLAAGLAVGQAAAPDPLAEVFGSLNPDDLGLEPAPEPATLGGLWVLADGGGPTRYLELYAGRRFVYRDGRGNVTAGEARDENGRLTLSSQGVRRVFVYALSAGELELIADLTDRPGDGGPLATMPPVGAAIVVYRRRGQEADRWELPLTEQTLLSGRFTLDTGRGRRESLTFGPRDHCRYEGPGTVAADAAYRFEDGRLILTGGPVTRHFGATLWFTPDGWRLRLERAADDHPLPASDLADVSPIFRPAVEYRRALDRPQPADLLGRYQYAFDDVTVRLVMLEQGQARYIVGQEVMPLIWSLQDAVLTLQVVDDLGPVSTRRFWAQRVPGGLVVIPFEDRGAAPDDLLGQLPPRGTPFAYWTEG